MSHLIVATQVLVLNYDLHYSNAYREIEPNSQQPPMKQVLYLIQPLNYIVVPILLRTFAAAD